jgi:DNA-binding MarR family transcriptional regulator
MKGNKNMKNIGEVYPKAPSLCNCMNIRRASRATTQFYDEVLKSSGLTIAQLSLLRHIEGGELPTISELANMMRIDRTTLNRNVKPLVDAGMIVINPGKDSRTRQLALTEVGREVVVKGWELWGEAQASLKEYLGEDDLAKIIQLLSKLEALVP